MTTSILKYFVIRKEDRSVLAVIVLATAFVIFAFYQGRTWSQQTERSAVSIDDVEPFRTRIDEFLNAAHTKAGFGGAVIVARGGHPIYQGAFGFSQLDSKPANTVDTPFRIASLS